MKQEEQTCIEDSPIYINAGWLLIAYDKEELQISMLLFGAPFLRSFLLCVKIIDILHNDESLCFLNRGLQLNNKLKTSPNISNLTLKFLTEILMPYTGSLWKKPACQGIFEFFKTHAHLCKGIACV
jgi:hypothetical protein